MNRSTELNSELLSADARGKKQIPFAVFAVILIHIILFVVLLVAAGCRSTVRARAKVKPEPLAAPAEEVQHPANRYLQAATTNTPAAQPLSAVTEPVVATEPVVEEEPPAPTPAAQSARPVSQVQPQNKRTSPRQASHTKPALKKNLPSAKAVYVVQAGDTVEKIAKRHGTSIQGIMAANKLRTHVIQPGQKLIVQPARSAEPSTAQIKPVKTSNEV
jgi:LysM repeat protein